MNSDTSITATVPAQSAGNVNVIVTTPYGTSQTTFANQFTYAPAPVVDSLSQDSGITGGDTITISGSGFTGATGVSFGGVAATSYTVSSDSSITAVVPAQLAGTIVGVTVTTPGGVSTTPSGEDLTYGEATVVGGLGQSSGPTDGGYTITVSGSGFTGATAVSFGSVPAISYTVNSDSSITATVPAQAEGTIVDVTVTALGGTSAISSADQFTYVETQAVTGFSFSVWLYPGDTLSSIDYQFTSAAFGTAVYASGTASSITLSGGTVNSYGFYEYTATVTGLNISVPVGTSWFTLQNAVVPSGDPAYWGENDGASQAFENTVGAIGSESFAIAGTAGTLYDNGPDPGTVNAWTVNLGCAVTNSFYVSA